MLQKQKYTQRSVSKSKLLVVVAAFLLVAAPASWFVSRAAESSLVATTGTAQDGQNGALAGNGGQSDSAQAKAGGSTADSQSKSSGSSATSTTGTSGKPAAGTSSGGTAGASGTSGSSAGAKTAGGSTPSPQPVAALSADGVHNNIITTIFWVGETAGADNANISNGDSAWDSNWQLHFGGFDDPASRNGYYPAAFTPLENPFYVALPYNDLDGNGDRKPTASPCPNHASSVSWCKNAWIKISKGGKTVYAQWQDVGPINEDDYNYVFGSAAPANTWGAAAGLDVSPAIRDYLGLQDVDHTTWSFVGAGSVPAGPWKNIVTTSAGGW